MNRNLLKIELSDIKEFPIYSHYYLDGNYYNEMLKHLIDVYYQQLSNGEAYEILQRIKEIINR
jgi:hypothetical protein